MNAKIVFLVFPFLVFVEPKGTEKIVTAGLKENKRKELQCINREIKEMQMRWSLSVERRRSGAIAGEEQPRRTPAGFCSK